MTAILGSHLDPGINHVIDAPVTLNSKRYIFVCCGCDLLCSQFPRSPGKCTGKQPDTTAWTRFIKTTGLVRSTLHNWESVARIPEAEFDKAIADIVARDDPKAIITATPFYRLGRCKPPEPEKDNHVRQDI